MDYRVIAVGSLLACLICPPLHAAVYKWTDEHGRVHFSDRPVAEDAKPVEIRSRSPQGGSGGPVTPERKELRQRMLDSYEQDRADKREAQKKARQAKDERKKKCLNARARYDEYSTAGSIYNYLESGEREYLDKSQRERFIAKLKADIDRYCD